MGSRYLHFTLLLIWQVPLVEPLDVTMQLAPARQPGPTPVVEHGSPSAAAATHLPVAPASLVLHLPLEAQGPYWSFTESHGPLSGETEMGSHRRDLPLQTRPAS
jgi:hypothetical protein